MLAGNPLSRIRNFWYNVYFNKETNLSNDHNGNNIVRSSNYKYLINDNSAIQFGSVKSILKWVSSNQPQQFVISHLNINSIRNTFDTMRPMLMLYIDIFMVTEIKSEVSFPVSHFNVEGLYWPFRLYWNKKNGDIILYSCNYIIASKLTSFTFPNDIGAFFHWNKS